MRLRLYISALIFFGSYFPLSIILLVQDYDFGKSELNFYIEIWKQNCEIPLQNQYISLSFFFISLTSLIITFLIIDITPAKRSIKLCEIKYIPSELMNYTLPYVVSFMNIDYNQIGKFIGIFIFLGWMFIITHRSGQIIMNPILIVFGWRLYDISYSVPGEKTEHHGTLLTRIEISPGDSVMYSEIQDVLIGRRLKMSRGTEMVDLDDLKKIDITGAELSLWTFKGTTPSFNGHWIETTNSLAEELKSVFSSHLERHTEQIDYSLLSENNEASVLTLPIEETHADIIVNDTGNVIPTRRTRNVKTLRNARFYVVRLSIDDNVILATRKTDSTWNTKNAMSILSVIYKENSLDLSEDAGFRIYKNFDFYIYSGIVFISNKVNFESIVSYRRQHQNDFLELQNEPEFLSSFSSIDGIVEFFGNNRLHLRRISAIRQKGFYKDATFMKNLRERHQEFNLNID